MQAFSHAHRSIIHLANGPADFVPTVLHTPARSTRTRASVSAGCGSGWSALRLRLFSGSLNTKARIVSIYCLIARLLRLPGVGGRQQETQRERQWQGLPVLHLPPFLCMSRPHKASSSSYGSL